MYLICHSINTVGGASPTVAVVKTAPTPPTPVISSVTFPSHKPVQNSVPRSTVSTITSTSSTPKHEALTDASYLQSASPSSTIVVTPIPLTSSPSGPSTNPSLPSAGATVDGTQKISPTLPSSSTSKATSPFVLPKPQSPVNVVTPMTQTAAVLPPPSVVTPPSTPTKPTVASVPTYVPTITATARVAPTPVSFTPQVLQTSSLSPIGDGASTPARGTPSGRATPSTALRQGVPQKPYTFLDEKAR